MTSIVDSIRSGDRLALARLLTRVENDSPEGREALDALFRFSGRAHLVGITGSPGTGKSSLVNQLTRAWRHPADGSSPLKVAIIAIDPSSPFTGGALLGDRVRMRDLSGDPGVFIRSMASRGSMGGLARTTASVAQVLDAAGFDIVLIETVGAGQSEVDIARLAHTTIVVEAPGLGDDIQASKAGILEIADILVVNKADMPGAESTRRALRNMLELAHPDGNMTDGNAGWVPPVLNTVAITSTGIEAVTEAVRDHRVYLKESGEWQKREQARLLFELNALMQAALVSRWRSRITDSEYQAVLDDVLQRRLSTFSAVDRLLEQNK